VAGKLLEADRQEAEEKIHHKGHDPQKTGAGEHEEKTEDGGRKGKRGSNFG
jgi:hypothetical protein